MVEVLELDAANHSMREELVYASRGVCATATDGISLIDMASRLKVVEG